FYLTPSTFLLLLRHHPSSTLFPYTTLFRSRALLVKKILGARCGENLEIEGRVLLGRFTDIEIGRNVQINEECRLQFQGSLHSVRSEEHTSELQSRGHLVCRLLLEKKKI